jgi:hypothetical protein
VGVYNQLPFLAEAAADDALATRITYIVIFPTGFAISYLERRRELRL